MAYRAKSLILSAIPLLALPALATADASVDGFYRSDYVESGVFEGNQGDPSRSAFGYTPAPTVEEAPLMVPYLHEPKVYEGRFTKTTRGVEASEVIDGDESAKGIVIVPIREQ